MTTQTSAPTSIPARTVTARATPPKAAIASVPDPHDMTGAWVLSIVTALMALTIGIALYLAKQIQL